MPAWRCGERGMLLFSLLLVWQSEGTDEKEMKLLKSSYFR